jgi:hypothetical protein
MDDSHDSPPPDSANSSARPAGTPSPGLPPPHPEGWQGAPRHTPCENPSPPLLGEALELLERARIRAQDGGGSVEAVTKEKAEARRESR